MILAFAALTTPAVAEPVALDDFLAGFSDGCRQSEDWTAFRRTMVGDDLALTRRTEIPPGLRAAFGRAEIVATDPADGAITVEIPITDATFRGLPVTALRLGYASGYPLIDDSVIFAATGDAARAAFADDIARFAKANPESIVEYGLHDDPAGPRLTCFATN
jgi:hypothetical protein